jgi:hypothetical protein
MAGKDLFAPASETKAEKAKGKDLFASSTSASPFLQKGMNMTQGAMATPPRQPAAWEAGARDYVANMPERERGGIESGGDAFLFNVGNVLTAGGMQRAGNQVVPGKNLGDAAVTEGESYYPTASVLGRGVGYAAPASQGGRVASMATQDLISATGVRALAPKTISEGTGALARGTRYLGRGATLAPVGALQVGAYEGLVEQPVRDFMAGEESTIGGRVRAGANALANPINYGVLPAASLVGRLGKSVVTGVATPGDVQRAVTAGSRGAVPLSEGQLAADAAQILDTQAMNAIDPRGFKLVERILRQSGVADSDVPAVNAKVREILKAAPDAVAGRLTVGQVYAKALYDLDKTQAGENILKVLRERRNVTDVKDRSPSIVGNEVRDLRGSQVDFITQSAESNLGAGKRIDIKNAVADTKKQIGGEYERVLAEADPTRPEAPALTALVMGDQSKGVLTRRAKNAGFLTPEGKGDVDAYARARPDQAAHWLRSHLAKAARSSSGRERIDLEDTVDQLDDLLDTNPGYAQARQQYGTEIGVDEARDIGSNFITASRNQGNLDLLLEEIAALPPRQRDVALLSIRDNLLSPVRGSGEDAPARISQLVSVGTLEGLERLGPAGKGLADDIRAIRDENNFLGQIDSGNPLRQSATFSNADAAANAPDLYSGGIARTLNAGGGSSLPADIAISAITGTPIAPFTLAKIARGGLQSVFAPGRKSKEAMTQFLMTRPRNALPSGTPPAGAPPPQAPPPLTTGAPAMAAPAGAPVPPPRPASAGAPPLNSGPPGPQFPHVVEVTPSGSILHTSASSPRQGGQEFGFRTRREAEEYLNTGGAAPAGAPVPPPIRTSGLIGNGDLTNAAYGAGLGGIAPAESPEERARNMAIGAGVGIAGGSRTVGKVLGVQGDDVARTAGLGGSGSGNAGRFRFGPTGKAFNPYSRQVQDEIIRTSGGTVTERNIEDLMSVYTDDLLNSTPQEIVDNLKRQAGEIPMSPRDVEYAGFAELMARQLTPMRPDKAASPILTAGAGGVRKPPKPDSPEAIRNALKGMAKPPKPPTRLEQMVEEGKGAVVPPINAMPSEAGAAGSKALRMLERGKTPLDIYDETSVALLPYNGANIPIVSSKMGPEELTRVFYGWLAEPPAKRPAWVKRIIDDAPKKKGMLLTERQQVAPPQANALAPPPLPKNFFPGGAIAIGAGAGILTGIPAGAAAGALMAREQDRKRRQPPPPPPPKR